MKTHRLHQNGLVQKKNGSNESSYVFDSCITKELRRKDRLYPDTAPRRIRDLGINKRGRQFLSMSEIMIDYW